MRLMPGPDPLVVGDGPAVAERPDPVQVGDDLDPAADHGRVDRVVVGVQPDVVVARQPGRGPPPGRRGDRRQRQHRRLVRGDPVGRGAAQRPPRPGVHQREPVLQLGVEVGRAGERPAGQERALQVVVGPLDDALGLRLGGLAAPPPSPPACRGTPDTRRSARACPARHRPIAPSPSQTSARGTAPSRAISCHQPANRSGAARVGISSADSHREYAGHHRQHRQLRRPADLPEPDRHRDRREPQVALRDLPGRIARPARRVRRQISRPQLRAPAPSAPSAHGPSRSAPRSPSPASSDTPATAHGSAARPRPRSTPPACAHTSAARHWRSPPAPCSSRSPAPGRSP